MATKSKIARDKLLTKLNSHEQNRKTRMDLKSKVRSLESSPEEKMLAMFALSGRRVDESASRQTRRCWKCGRPKGVYRRFGLCRCCIRSAMTKGWLVGLRKASW